jgi:hypothetical protein
MKGMTLRQPRRVAAPSLAQVGREIGGGMPTGLRDARRLPHKHLIGILGALFGIGALAACSTSSMAPTSPVVPSVAIATDNLVGKWGIGSYREEKDFARTTAEAKSACSNPYVISKGSSGGVVMHLADQSAPSELFVKQAADGRVFVGPQGKPGDKLDRQVMSYENGVLITRWVDPDAATRYGTMILVRCTA